ncbi:unnamed protein product [Dracunculus medinensis]|uniref:DUF3485 domain-containing protein n=1 Tax=Dracunculus medinensis TaxID=318479 RepID=A0A0N4U3A9_DRAME|nr:unnamed protein product [Dracunculus medinensis]
MKILLLSVTLSVVVLEGEKITRENMPAAKYYDGKKFVIPIAHKTMEDIRDRWLQQAMSGLITGVSLKNSVNLSVKNKIWLKICIKRSKNVNEQARCVIEALGPRKFYKMDLPRIVQIWSLPLRNFNDHRNQPNEDEWIGGFFMFQARRFENRESDITSQNNYKLLTENANRSPFGFIAEFLKKNIQYIKEKTDSKPWFIVLARFEQLEAELKMHDELKRTLMGELKLFSEGRIKELLLELNNPDVFVYFY